MCAFDYHISSIKCCCVYYTMFIFSVAFILRNTVCVYTVCVCIQYLSVCVSAGLKIATILVTYAPKIVSVQPRVSRSTLQLRRPPKQHTPATLTTYFFFYERYPLCYCLVFSLSFQTMTNCSLFSLQNAFSFYIWAAGKPHPTTLTNTFSAGNPEPCLWISLNIVTILVNI